MAALVGAELEGVGVLDFWVGSFFGFLFGFLAVWCCLAAASSLALDDDSGDWAGWM